MEVTSKSKFLRAMPSKVRLIADLVRGKKVDEALTILKFTPSPLAAHVAKVVKTAAADAENNYEMTPANLKVVRALVDTGPLMKRFRAQARGRAAPILKRTCHISITVEEQEA